MTVQLMSPKDEVMFEGAFDQVVAAENAAEFLLKCQDCGKENQGTVFELAEDGWEWEIQINKNTVEIVESQAVCKECNDGEQEDLELYEKAEKDENQQTFGDFLQ